MHNWFLIRSGRVRREKDSIMQRTSTIRLRAEPAGRGHRDRRRESSPPTFSLDDLARRVASSRRQLQRAYAEIGRTTFREHLTGVRMERAAEMLGHARPDRARGRPPGRLPPAGAVREGLPPPPRPVAVGPSGCATARRSRGRPGGRTKRPSGDRPADGGAPPGPGARPRDRRIRAPGPCFMPHPRRDCIGSPAMESGGGIAAARPSRNLGQMVVIGVTHPRWGSPRAGHRLVPGPGSPRPTRRHALGRPGHLLGAGLRARDDRRPVLGLASG